MAQFIRSNYTDLFGSGMLPAMEVLFRDEIAQHPMKREAVIKVENTDRDIWQSSEMHDLQQFNQINEGADFSFVAPRQGLNKTIVPVKYGLGFSISEEAIADGKFDAVAYAVRQLARSAQESQEISGMNLFNGAFGTTDTPDGLNLCSTDHTLPSGLTFRNRLASDADLSDSSLETALLDFETQFKSDNGKILNIKPKVLLVHPSNKRLAKKLLQSELSVNNVASGGDNGPTNAMNVYKEEGLIVISSPHLTDLDAWFLCSSPEEAGLRIINRRGIETKSEVSFINDSVRYKSSYREQVGAVHARGIIGTSGA